LSEKQRYLEEVLQKTRDFSSIPTYSAFGDGKWFFTAKRIAWKPNPGQEGDYNKTNVPKGFVTDLASIPKAFWSLMPRDGVYLAAAIIHDYNYWFQEQTRFQADKIFDLGMQELGVSYLTRKTIYHSVRIGGNFSWNNNQKLRKKGERRILKKLPNSPNVKWSDWKEDLNVFL
jgi:hypothetical protein